MVAHPGCAVCMGQNGTVAFRRARVIRGLIVLLFSASSSVPHSGETDTGVTVYSEEQAHKGHDLYEVHCASCHGSALEGQGSLPLSGATFRTRWADDRHSWMICSTSSARSCP